ncbi:hypothetical protein BD414DRAFT_155643 [Trametes punicea]|nr:hypothetical protein BD414DRAFT_155643 [Trametes punicea]
MVWEYITLIALLFEAISSYGRWRSDGSLQTMRVDKKHVTAGLISAIPYTIQLGQYGSLNRPGSQGNIPKLFRKTDPSHIGRSDRCLPCIRKASGPGAQLSHRPGKTGDGARTGVDGSSSGALIVCALSFASMRRGF